eukprot:5394690-Ditylum_brightwellii.AAC.1
MDGDPFNGYPPPGNYSFAHDNSDNENENIPPPCICRDSDSSSNEDMWPFPPAPPPRLPPLDSVSLGLLNILDEMDHGTCVWELR